MKKHRICIWILYHILQEVSEDLLKSALAAEGFTGVTRGATELNQWIASEKQELATVMERYGLEWLQKGTHEKHLSVLEFEKKERARKVAELDSQKREISSVVAQLGEEVSVKKQELKNALRTTEQSLAKLHRLLDNKPIEYVVMALSGEMQAYCDIEDDMVKGMFGTIVQGYLKKGYNRATAEMMAREFFRYES